MNDPQPGAFDYLLEPLRGGTVRKGGSNPPISQITVRPPDPPPLRPNEPPRRQQVHINIEITGPPRQPKRRRLTTFLVVLLALCALGALAGCAQAQPPGPGWSRSDYLGPCRYPDDYDLQPLRVCQDAPDVVAERDAEYRRREALSAAVGRRWRAAHPVQTWSGVVNGEMVTCGSWAVGNGYYRTECY